MNLRYASVFGALCSILAASDITPASAQNGGTGLKITATGSRRTANASYQPGASPNSFVGDSTVFHYPDNTTDNHSGTSGYNGTRGAQTLVSKGIEVRNAQGQATVSYGLVWQASTSTFDTLSRTTYTYDGAGNNVYELGERRTTTAAPWVQARRVTRVFDAAHQVIKFTSENWRTSASVWDTSQQYEYAYNSQGSYIKQIFRSWKTSTHVLDYVDSSLATYDASGIAPLSGIGYRWTAATGVFKPLSRSTYTLNGNGQVILLQNEAWNSSASSWVQGSKTTTAYLSSGLGATDTIYTWAAATSSYVINSRILRLWNSYDQETQYLVEAYNGSMWEHNFSYFNYYEPYNELGIGSSAPKAQDPRINISPNPASSYVTINMQWDAPQDFTMMITDIQGRVYQQISGSAGQKQMIVAVDDLPAGNYVLSVNGSAGAGSSRMITVRH